MVVESKDKTKSKFGRRKDLFIAASKNDIRDLYLITDSQILNINFTIEN